MWVLQMLVLFPCLGVQQIGFALAQEALETAFPGAPDILLGGSLHNHVSYAGRSHQKVEEMCAGTEEVVLVLHTLIGIYHILQMNPVPALQFVHWER